MLFLIVYHTLSGHIQTKQNIIYALYYIEFIGELLINMMHASVSLSPSFVHDVCLVSD